MVSKKRTTQEEQDNVLPPVTMPNTIVEMQAHSRVKPATNEELYPTQLVVTGGNDVVIYHVSLPQSILVGLLNPTVADGFIELQIEATSTNLPIPTRSRHRFLHTSQIREVVFDKDLPDGVLGGGK